MPLERKNFRDVPIIDSQERPYIGDNDQISARSYDVWENFEASEYLMVKLEVLEHVHVIPDRKRDSYDYSYDYEKVIRIYVKGIDIHDTENHTTKYYDKSFERLGFIHYQKNEDGNYEWVDTNEIADLQKFKIACANIKSWISHSYDVNLLDFELTCLLLYKLFKAGDLLAKRVWNEDLKKEEILTRIESFNGKPLFALEVKALVELEFYVRGKRRKYKYLEKEFPPFNYLIENTHVIKLAIVGYDIKNVPKSIGNFSVLASLNLSCNDLRLLPESMGNLRSLMFLDLTENKLGMLPNSIGNLASLRWLNLDHNDLLYLPDSMGNLASLEFISLAFNDKFEPKNFPKYCDRNKIERWDARKLVEFYRSKLQGNAEKVSFKSTEFFVVDGGLDLSGVGVKNLDEIKGIRELKTLKKLNLNSCPPRRREKIIKDNTHHLTLKKYNNFDKYPVKRRQKMIRQKIPDYNPHKPLAEQLIRHGMEVKWIPKVLDRLEQNELSIEDLAPLENLEELSMEECNLITLNGIERFARLKKLNVRFNQITEIKGFERLEHLEELNLSFNQIAEIKGLGALKNLKELDLMNNKISELKGLEHLESAEKIYFVYNPIPANIETQFKSSNFDHDYAKQAQALVEYCRSKKLK